MHTQFTDTNHTYPANSAILRRPSHAQDMSSVAVSSNILASLRRTLRPDSYPFHLSGTLTYQSALSINTTNMKTLDTRFR
ncbi:hypothetical protein GJ744_005427 [Endocarpon pusillum]|uniref:Uncharacterized protein n=1 Tax=Endocarpon pusillum TaxID=364733 RepID=A0A8H7A8M1_9EURO|nr:hypothetical protein GJ744_005427 [Endocarpon pusillum]